MMRETARGILRSKFPDLCVNEAGNGAEALDLINHQLPDMILMDIGLPGDSGLKLTRKIKKLYPQIVVIIFTNHDHCEYREAAIESGAEFFLSKSSPGKYRLIEVVASALRDAVGS